MASRRSAFEIVTATVVLIIVAVVVIAWLTHPEPEVPEVRVKTEEVPVTSRTCTKALFQANDVIAKMSEGLSVTRKGLLAATEGDTEGQERAIEQSEEIDSELTKMLAANLELTEQCLLEEGT